MSMPKEILKLLTSTGESMTLRKNTPGDYNTATSSVSVSTSNTTITAKIIQYKNSEIDGEMIQRKDRRILIAGSGLAVVPTAKDQIIDPDSKVYDIINIHSIKINDSVIAYAAQGREA